MDTAKPTVDDVRFRLTRFWPGVEVPIPAVHTSTSVEVVDDRILYFVQGYPTVSIPDELVIRELVDLDVSSAEDVVAFVRTYGIINRTAEMSGLVGAVKLSKDEQNDLPSSGRRMVRIVDVAMHLQEVQVLARHFIARRRGLDTRPAWVGYVPRATEWEAEDAFASALNRGLQWYHVHVRAEFRVSADDQWHEVGEPEAGLYSALCLQLYNMLVREDEVPLACPSCGSAFVRQRGRAVKGQNRSTGVTYCSKLCADRMASRAARQRKRNLKNGDAK